MTYGLKSQVGHPDDRLRTGVLIHGCHLDAAGWVDVVWGHGSERMGRLPQGLLTALELDADIVIVGSGASCRIFEDDRSRRRGQILREAEFTIETLRCRFDELKHFPAWRVHQNAWSEGSGERLRTKLLSMIEADLDSQTTIEELRNAGLRFQQQGIQRVVLISSPTHLPRVIRDAADVFHGDPDFASFHDRIHAIPSQTNFVGTRPSDVKVLEPPHRPDRNPQVFDSMRRLVDTDGNDETGLIGVLSEISDLAHRRQHASGINVTE